MSTVAKISIANMFFLTLLMGCAWFGIFSFEPIVSYRWHKFLHLAGVVVFLGNVILGPLWVVLSLKSKHIKTIQFTFKTLQRFDLYITAPSIAMVVINGLYMADVFGGVANSAWLRHSVYSLVFLWLLILPILVIQDKMDRLIKTGEIEGVAFDSLKFKWMVMGLVSFLPLVYICYLMVFKSVM